MYALLVLGQGGKQARVMVHLKKKHMQTKVAMLLEASQHRQAFDLLKDHAEVESYLPDGAKLSFIPQITLVEDIL